MLSVLSISPEETKQCTHTNIPILQPIFASHDGAMREKFFATIGWASLRGLVNKSMKIKWAKLTELLGVPSTLYMDLESRNAIWGLKIGTMKVVLYCSKEGLSVEVPPDVTHDQCLLIVETLHELLIDNRRV